jgi:RNA polymerase sigma factor (sigma-70 family)
LTTDPSDPRANEDPVEQRDLTSIHVRRAEAGDRASLEWVIERFTPALIAQARFRLRPALRALYDPEDVVADVWAVALPRLQDLVPQKGRLTPVLMKFLSTTLLNRLNDLARKQISRARAHPGAGLPALRDLEPLSRLPDETSGVVTRAAQSEAREKLAEALNQLEEKDREIIILRGIEQNANSTVAVLLDLAPNAVSMRYTRALERLRALLPGSFFDDLPAD